MPNNRSYEQWAVPHFRLPGDLFDAVRGIRGDIYREAPGRTTLRFEHQGRAYFLKYHRGVGWPEIFKNLMSLRWPVLSARNEWQAIERLQENSVPTMQAVAYGSRGRNPALIESFIITEELAPTVSLEDFTQNWAEQPAGLWLKRRLLSEVARMTRCMHLAGVNHRDLYVCHFLLHTDLLEAGHLKLSLIDLHRAQLRDEVPLRWRNKDLASLYFSSLHIGLSSRDLLRFLKVYFNEPLREVLKNEARQLRWLRKEGEFLRKKYLRKYAPQ